MQSLSLFRDGLHQIIHHLQNDETVQYLKGNIPPTTQSETDCDSIIEICRELAKYKTSMEAL